MKLVPQTQKFEIKLSAESDDPPGAYPSKHGALFPKSIRGGICGPSNCGKTCVMVNLLYHPQGLKFANVYLYCKTLFQPKYQKLESLINSIPGMSYNCSSDSIIPISEIKPHSIVIFDDVVTELQTPIKSIYCMGRHKGLDCFYLSQTYTAIPKHLLRDNFNFIVIFKQDLLNIKHIYEDHVASDMSYSKFQDICHQAWDGCHSFLVIAKEFDMNNGRYRKGFDQFFQDINT